MKSMFIAFRHLKINLDNDLFRHVANMIDSPEPHGYLADVNKTTWPGSHFGHVT